MERFVFNYCEYLLLLAYILYQSSHIVTDTTKGIKATTTTTIRITVPPHRISTNSKSSITTAALSADYSITCATTPTFVCQSPLIMGSCLGRCLSKESQRASATSCFRAQSIDEQETDLMPNETESCRRDNFIFRIMKFKSKRKRPQFIDKFWERQDLQYAKLSTRNGTESLSDIQLQNLDVQHLLNATTLAKESALNNTCTFTGARGSTAAASSRASSSLDLEWEHEYAQMRHLANISHANPNTFTNLRNKNSNERQTNLNDSWQLLTTEDDHASLQSFQTGNQLEPNTERRSARTHHGSKTHAARNSSLTRNTSTQNSWSHISTPESLEWDIDEDQQRQLRVEDDNLDHETLQLLHQIEQLKNQVLNETGEGWYGYDNDGIEITTNNGNETINIS